MSAKQFAYLVDTEWFCRYQQMKAIIYDNGSNFTGREFGELMK